MVRRSRADDSWCQQEINARLVDFLEVLGNQSSNLLSPCVILVVIAGGSGKVVGDIIDGNFLNYFVTCFGALQISFMKIVDITVTIDSMTEFIKSKDHKKKPFEKKKVSRQNSTSNDVIKIFSSGGGVQGLGGRLVVTSFTCVTKY